MYEDPRYDAWFRENVPNLVKFYRKMNGPVDFALSNIGIGPDEIAWFRREIPKLCTIALNEAAIADSADPAIANVIRRIMRKTAPEFQGCQRWIGTIQGAKRKPDEPDGPLGGTPVIGFRGSTVPARRLLWNLKYQGSPEYLEDDQRLRGIGCREGSRCMTLAHWYKKTPAIDLGAVRASLEEAELFYPAETRICAAGKHQTSAANCPDCALDSRRERATVSNLSFEAGRAIRRQLRQS